MSTAAKSSDAARIQTVNANDLIEFWAVAFIVAQSEPYALTAFGVALD